MIRGESCPSATKTVDKRKKEKRRGVICGDRPVEWTRRGGRQGKVTRQYRVHASEFQKPYVLRPMYSCQQSPSKNVYVCMYESAQASRGRAEISQDNPPTRRTVRHRAGNAQEHARERKRRGLWGDPTRMNRHDNGRTTRRRCCCCCCCRKTD